MKSLVAAMEPILLWVLFSLLAIAFVGSRPYVALAISVVGGVSMALSSLASFHNRLGENAGDFTVRVPERHSEQTETGEKSSSA